MVDRVYKGSIPELRKSLEHLREEFSHLNLPTDWVRLRVDPVLKHAKELEALVTSRRFSKEFSRLTKGVALFHSDLVYLRTNVQALRKLLRVEAKKRAR
jgi:hypothetical protein